jgi:hypothetical protein
MWSTLSCDRSAGAGRVEISGANPPYPFSTLYPFNTLYPFITRHFFGTFYPFITRSKI